MRAKFINEVFDEESDPIEDMKIGRVKCPKCNGTGSYPDHDINSIDIETGEHDCRYCPIETECEKCEGTGLVSKKKYKELNKKPDIFKYNGPDNDLPF